RGGRISHSVSKNDRLASLQRRTRGRAAMADLETFRAETRAWLEANCPPEVRGPRDGDEDYVWGGRNAVFKTPAHKLWLDRMAARGWTAPEWPRAYGGGGLSREEAKVLAAEM